MSQPKSLIEIAEMLSKRYNKGYPDGRTLNVATGNNGYGRPVYFFTLQGSPPKGYGIYTPEKNTLWLFDAWGKRFRKFEDITIPELNNPKEKERRNNAC